MSIIYASCAAIITGVASYFAVFGRMARTPEPARGRTEAASRQHMSTLTGIANKVLPQTQEARGKLRKRLVSAGLTMSPSIYHGLSVLFWAASVAVLGSVLAALDMQTAPKATLTALAAAIVLLCPRAALSVKARARREQIKVALPRALDLLATSIEAGLTPQRSIRIVAQHSKGALAHEFGIADRDMAIMRYTLPAALDRMAERCGVEALSQFVAALSAGTAVGASVGDVLKSQSKHVFRHRRQELQARANKLPVRMIMPIGFLMLPAVILAFAAPVAINLISKLSGVQ